jgi:transcriptional regulator with XRE-family HTH domain
MNAKWFGGRLREIREAKGITRRALAQLTGLTEDGLYKLESGAREPAWGTVLTLAQALQVQSLDELAAKPTEGHQTIGPGRPSNPKSTTAEPKRPRGRPRKAEPAPAVETAVKKLRRPRKT